MVTDSQFVLSNRGPLEQSGDIRIFQGQRGVVRAMVIYGNERKYEPRDWIARQEKDEPNARLGERVAMHD